MTINDLAPLTFFNDRRDYKCQVYNAMGNCIFCGYWTDVVHDYGNAVVKDIDKASGMFFITFK